MCVYVGGSRCEDFIIVCSHFFQISFPLWGLNVTNVWIGCAVVTTGWTSEGEKALTLGKLEGCFGYSDACRLGRAIELVTPAQVVLPFRPY